MKKLITFHVFALLLLCAISASAQTRGIGIGGYVQTNRDEMGGINGKVWLNSNNAFDLSVSIQDNPFGQDMGAYVSYLYHFWGVIPSSSPKLPLYVGPNGGIGVWDGGYALRFGAVGGLDVCIVPIPMDFYLQLNPTFEFRHFDDNNYHDNSGLGLTMYLQLGARFWFGG